LIHFAGMKLFIAVAAVSIAILANAQSVGPYREFASIYGAIQRADELSRTSSAKNSRQAFLEAYEKLSEFKNRYPTFNKQIVEYRLNLLKERVGPGGFVSLNPGVPTSTPTAEQVTANENHEANRRVNQLNLSNQQLNSEVGVLRNKLTEALRAQPNTVSAESLTEAQIEIDLLKKEVELLKVALEQEKRRAVAVSEGQIIQQEVIDKSDAQAEMESLKSVLSGAQRQLKERELEVNQFKADLAAKSRQITELQLLTTTLKSQIDSQSEDDSEATDLKIASLQDQNIALTRDNDSLKAQLVALSKEVLPVPDTSGKDRQISSLRMENESLRNQLSKAQSEAVVPTAPEGKDLAARNKDLQERLNAANKKLYDNETQIQLSKIERLTNQVAILRTKLDVYEAKKQPLTPEEKALIEIPEIQGQTSVAKSRGKTSKTGLSKLPAGSGPLVEAARIAFRSRRYETAEKHYLQVLKLDENNPYTLANLAAVQIDAGKLPEAESNLKKALVSNPTDSFALAMFGTLKLKQNEFDKALEYLSQSVKYDPDYPVAQTHLGIVLNQKGQKNAAEAALRKAISLEQNNPTAHYNLALVYAGQTPGFPELAKWHYNKATASGYPPNSEFEKFLKSKER
jgi:tetratricopeptide (TPR) repeat protein